MLRGINLVAGFSKGSSAWAVSKPIDIEVKDGELLFILGPNGSGKTTLLRTLAKLIPQISGDTTGCESIFLPSELEVQEWTSADVVCDVLRVTNFDLLSKLKTVFGLDDIWKKPLHILSAGERKKIFLACTIASPKKNLILDEPQNFLEIRSVLDLEILVKDELSKGRTIVISSHDLGWVSRFENAKTILIGLEGQNVEMGVTKTLFESPQTGALFGVTLRIIKPGLVETTRKRD